MKEKVAEWMLSVLYVSSAILSLTSLVSLLTVWRYWAWTLDVCISIDCGCILYSINTFRTFTGGDAKLCHFGVYGLIPAILISLFLGGYHGYRSCINKNLEEPVHIYNDTTSRNLNIDQRTVVIRPGRRRPYKQWIPAVFLAILLSCLSLTHAVVTTDGYYKSCDQYRKRLIQMLDSTGPTAEVIHNRLSCGAIFDFMDYLQPDISVSDLKRGKEIDTGFALRLTIVSTWFNFSAWILALLVNVTMAWKKLCCRRRSDTE